MDIAADANHVYFTDWSGAQVMRMPKDGGAATPVATSQDFAFRSPIVVDATEVYWVAESGMMKSAILRVSKLTTSSPEVLVDDEPAIAGLVVDDDNLYFTSFFGGAVRRVAKRGGAGAVRDIATGIKGPVGIAVDGTNVYWASKDDGVVSTVSKAASPDDTPTTLARDLVGPYAVAIDATHVYWSTALKSTGTIARAPLDGRGPVTTLATGVDNPTSIATSGTHIYWSTMTSVCRVAKMGGAVEVLASGAPGSRALPQLSAFAPKGLVVDGGSVFCVNLAGSGSVERFDATPHAPSR